MNEKRSKAKSLERKYPAHARAHLRERCGTEQALLAGIRYLDEAECKELVGLPRDGKPSDGLRVPLNGSSYTVRFLRANALPKFKQEAGSRNMFYEPPWPREWNRSWDAIRKNAKVWLYIVEGPIKANALVAEGITTVGINGTYGWMSKHEPIADFGNWDWQGRVVVLCFDSDVAEKPEVRIALARLWKYLRKLGARPRIKLLEPGDDHAKMGPDDYVRTYGSEAFRNLKNYRPSDPRFFDWDAPLRIQEMNAKLGFCLLGGRAVVVHVEPDPDYPGTTRAVLSKASDTELMYRNQKFEIILEKKGKSKVKLVPLFPYWLAHKKRRDIRRLILNPEQPCGYDPATKDYNLWQGWGVNEHKPDEKHSWDLLKAHIQKVIAKNSQHQRDYVLNTLAFWVQHPATIPEAALVLIGGQGSGKGTVLWAMVQLFGRHGIHLYAPRQIVGNFNAHLKDKLFIFADEALFAGDPRIVGVLHALITEPRVVIEPKFQEVFDLPNFRKLGIATNEQWAVPASIDARRFAVLEVSEEVKQDERYFGRIKRQLEAGGLQAMLYDLRRRDITGFHPRQIPKTGGLWDQKRLSFDPTTEWWFDCLVNGYVHPSEPKWPRRIPCSVVQSIVLESCDAHQRRALDTKIGLTLKKLCPSISKFRTLASDDTALRSKKRAMHYRLPDLTACRKFFEKAVMQQIEWRTGEAK